jgi:hypothetical protein
MAKKSSFIRTDNLIKKLDNTKTVAKQRVSGLTIEVAELGADKMRELIETKGTNRDWSGPWYSAKTNRYRSRSGPGRIDSGDMLNNVTAQFQRGQKESRAAFGWLKKYEEYYEFQEEGFTHWVTNEEITGMFALRDARRYVVSQLPKIIKKYENRINKGISP